MRCWSWTLSPLTNFSLGIQCYVLWKQPFVRNAWDQTIWKNVKTNGDIVKLKNKYVWSLHSARYHYCKYKQVYFRPWSQLTIEVKGASLFLPNLAGLWPDYISPSGMILCNPLALNLSMTALRQSHCYVILRFVNHGNVLKQILTWDPLATGFLLRDQLQTSHLS